MSFVRTPLLIATLIGSLSACQMTVGDPTLVQPPAEPIRAGTVAEVQDASRNTRLYISCDARRVGMAELVSITRGLTYAQVASARITTAAVNLADNGLPLNCGARPAIAGGQVENVVLARTKDGISVALVEWRQPNGFLVIMIDPDGGYRRWF